MKLQIQNQTLRFRIGETELALLLDTGRIEARTHLPDGATFIQSLVCKATPAPRLECLPQQWSVILPETEVRAYAEKLPSRKGLKWIIGDDDDAITLMFEVDVHDSVRNRVPRISNSGDGRRQPSHQDREDT